MTDKSYPPPCRNYLQPLYLSVTLYACAQREEVHGSASQVKKLKSDSIVKWRSEGNRIQFTFNSELCEELAQVEWAIDNGKRDYAVEIVSSVSDKLKRRNKLIKIADSSDGRWETERQYESNPVASDSDDESKINRAESRAIKERKNSKSKSRASADKQDIATTTPLHQQLFRDPSGPVPLGHFHSIYNIRTDIGST